MKKPSLRLYFLAHTIFCSAFLATAYWFEYYQHMPPCELCWYQRYAWFGALFIALWGVFQNKRFLADLLNIPYILGASIALFHTGVEQGWWEYHSACASAITATDAATLLAQLQAAAIVRCDEIPWQFANLSMAAWNAIINLAAFIGNGFILWKIYPVRLPPAQQKNQT